MNVLLYLDGEKVTGHIENISATKANIIINKVGKTKAVFLENVTFPVRVNYDTRQSLYYRNGVLVYDEIVEPEPEPTAEEMLNALLEVTSYE